MITFVLITSVHAAASRSRPASSLLTVASSRSPSVRRAYSALRRRPITAAGATACSAPCAEVCGRYVHRPRLHRPDHGALVLDDQGVVRLDSGNTVRQLRQARIEGSTWCTAENREGVTAVAEATVKGSSWCRVAVHTWILGPGVVATFVLTLLGVTPGKQTKCSKLDPFTAGQ